MSGASANGGTFRFLVIDPRGVRRELSVTANDAVGARSRLRQQGMIPLRELEPPGAVSGDGGSGFGRSFSFGRGGFDAAAFIGRLSPLLSANVPLGKALEVIGGGAGSEPFREAVFDLRRKLHEGRKFSELVRERREFPPICAGLIETGEEAGCLAEVVAELRRYLAEGKEFRDFVITGSIYPVSVLTVTLAVTGILFTVFIPRFAKVFANMGRELPPLTKAMMEVSRFVIGGWWIWPLLAAAAVILWRQCRTRRSFKRRVDGILLKLPVVGGVIESVQIGNFLQAMAIMVRNHVPLLDALRIARGILGNLAIEESFEPVAQGLREGRKFSEAFESVPYLPEGAGAMLRGAEESGEIGGMLQRIASEVREETRRRFKRLLVLLEPAMIVVLAIVVMTVVLAVFSAIWKMNAIR